MDILELLRHYQYLFLFVGALFAGETVVLPSIYLGIIGFFNLGIVAAVATAASLSSDVLWYCLGRYAHFDRLRTWRIFRGRGPAIDKVSHVFDRHGMKIVFWSNFVYGTRTAVQIASGMRPVPFRPYILADAGGTVAYLALLFSLAFLLDGASQLSAALDNAKVVFAVFVGGAIILNLVLHRVLGRRLFEEK